MCSALGYLIHACNSVISQVWRYVLTHTKMVVYEICLQTTHPAQTLIEQDTQIYEQCSSLISLIFGVHTLPLERAHGHAPLELDERSHDRSFRYRRTKHANPSSTIHVHAVALCVRLVHILASNLFLKNWATKHKGPGVHQGGERVSDLIHPLAHACAARRSARSPDCVCPSTTL